MGGGAAAELSGVLSLRRFELLDQMSGARESTEINAYLAAVADTLDITNTVLAGSGKAKLFCADTSLDVPLMRRLLRERIAFLAKLGQDTDAIKARSGIVIVIVQALREKYPCDDLGSGRRYAACRFRRGTREPSPPGGQGARSRRRRGRRGVARNR